MFQQRGPRPSPEQNSSNHWTFRSGQEIPSQSGSCSPVLFIFFCSFFLEMIFRILETFLLEPFASKPSATCLPWLIEMQLVPYVEGGGPEIASQLQNTLDVFVFWKRRESPAQHPRIILNCRVFGCSWLKCSMTSCSVILPKKNQSARKHVATLFWKPISASSVMTNVPNFQKNKRPALHMFFSLINSYRPVPSDRVFLLQFSENATHIASRTSSVKLEQMACCLL